jgi:hypothetical protein
MSLPFRASRRAVIRLAATVPLLAIAGCGDSPEMGTIDPRAEGIRPNRVRGKPAGSPVSTEPDPPVKGKTGR